MKPKKRREGKPSIIRYSRIEQLRVAHKIISEIHGRHKDKRKLLSKKELDELLVYLSTCRFTPDPNGRMRRISSKVGRQFRKD